LAKNRPGLSTCYFTNFWGLYKLVQAMKRNLCIS
jgi:hypothetical protein